MGNNGAKSSRADFNTLGLCTTTSPGARDGGLMHKSASTTHRSSRMNHKDCEQGEGCSRRAGISLDDGGEGTKFRHGAFCAAKKKDNAGENGTRARPAIAEHKGPPQVSALCAFSPASRARPLRCTTTVHQVHSEIGQTEGCTRDARGQGTRHTAAPVSPLCALL